LEGQNENKFCLNVYNENHYLFTLLNSINYSRKNLIYLLKSFLLFLFFPLNQHQVIINKKTLFLSLLFIIDSLRCPRNFPSWSLNFPYSFVNGLAYGFGHRLPWTQGRWLSVDHIFRLSVLDFHANFHAFY